MAIDRQTVRHFARLASLEYPRVRTGGQWREPDTHLVDDVELDKLAADLGRILEYVAELDALDLEGVEPTSHGVPLPPLLRPDQADSSVDPELLLAAAPALEGTAFVVPKVVE